MGNFGPKHLTGLLWLFSLIIITLIVLLTIRKKYHKGLSYDLWVIKGATIFIWGWEVVKTIYMVRSPAFGGVGDYPVFMLPCHICSMALYAYWIIGFKPGKLADFIKPFSFAVLLIVTSIILTIPDSSGIMGNEPNWHFIMDNLLPFQSFLYHGTLVFVPMYMVLSGFYKPTIKDTGKAMLTTLAVAIGAVILNKALGSTDFMTLEVGNGNPFQYLVQDQYVLYVLLLASIVFVATFAVLGIAQLIAMGIQALKNVKASLKNNAVRETV